MFGCRPFPPFLLTGLDKNEHGFIRACGHTVVVLTSGVAQCASCFINDGGQNGMRWEYCNLVCICS